MQGTDVHVGDRVQHPANLTGFSCQPLIVFTMASMSRAVMTEERQEEHISEHTRLDSAAMCFMIKVNDSGIH